VRDADAIVFRVYAADEFINDFGHVPRGLYASGALNVRRQNWSPCPSATSGGRRHRCAFEIASPTASAKRYHIGFSIPALQYPSIREQS
jgi:hypothetical protein